MDIRNASWNFRIERGPLRDLSLAQVVTALGLAALAVGLIRLFFHFQTETEVLLARSVGAAIVVLLAFTVASNVSFKWLPRHAARMLAIMLVSPIALAAAYVLTSEGTLTEIASREAVFQGWVRMTGLAVALGFVATLVFIYFERDREAREQALRFEIDRQTLEKELLATRLKALQAQIEPHFLFNTLANVQQLVESQSLQAAPLLKTLIRYLRLAIPNAREMQTTVEREFDLARNYLAIMQMRMSDRLQYNVVSPDELKSATLPPLAVMTLVENAVQHGIDPTEHGGHISVTAQRHENDSLRIEVTDTGGGLNEHGKSCGGSGLSTLRERLHAQYGSRATIELVDNAPQGVIVRVTLPLSY
jgi:two-component sensor histidine kinase